MGFSGGDEKDSERAGIRWGRLGDWEDMVFQRKRTRNLQILSANTVLSVRVGEDLKALLTGVRQIRQGEGPPIIYLSDEDVRRTTGHRPFLCIVEWKHAQEWDEVAVRRLAL